MKNLVNIISNDCGILVINSNQKQRPAPVPGRVDAVLRGEHRLHLDSNVLSSDLPSHLPSILVMVMLEKEQGGLGLGIDKDF